jgi:uncharacterized protein (DUF362 family)
MRRRHFLALGAEFLAAGAFASLIDPKMAAAAAGSNTAARPALASAGASSVEAAPLLCTAHGPDAAAITRAAVGAIGGIGRFVHRGDRVVVKPNIGWDRLPEHAANTNPEVVGALVRMCVDAGARSVLVLDNPCNDPRRCYQRSGIAEAVKAAGGTIDFFDEDRTRKMALKGERIKEWPVHPAFVEADVRINVPVAKQHSLAGLTLGMKNWLGAIGGQRGRLHQEIDASIVDLEAFFKPQLTVIDGVRILTRGGPSGGDLDAVKKLDLVVASADMLAAEVRGALFLGRKAEDLPHIALASTRGLGRSSWTIEEERVLEIAGS